VSLKTLRIDINPAWDLYHIETDREGGYIEFAIRQIYRAEPSEAYRRISSVNTNALLGGKKKGHRTQKRSMSFFLSVGIIF